MDTSNHIPDELRVRILCKSTWMKLLLSEQIEINLSLLDAMRMLFWASNEMTLFLEHGHWVKLTSEVDYFVLDLFNLTCWHSIHLHFKEDQERKHAPHGLDTRAV